jgi:tRNA-specific 2-thiouridylase
VRPFLEEYLAGRTPIPCTLCNNFLKFDQFLETAAGLGAERIATGHYARITRDPATGRHELRRGADPAKDQTYFLFGLTQRQLSARCSRWEDDKPEVRKLARTFALPSPGRTTARRSASCRTEITRRS